MNDTDRDLAIRTMIGEVDPRDGADGLRAVAHVIRNRTIAGRYGGSSPAEVVLARNAFEPWARRRADLMQISPTSKAYQKAGAVLDDVFSGESTDPTNGATHFYSPTDQAALGRKAPSWAKGEPVVIGGHHFFAPDGRVGSDPMEAINAAIGGKPDTVAALPFAEGDKPAGGLFRDAGFDVPGGAPAAAPAPTPAVGSLFKDAGFALPTDQPPPSVVAPSDPNTPSPQRFAEGVAKYGVNVPPPPLLQQIREATDPVRLLKAGKTNWDEAGLAAYQGGNALAAGGRADRAAGNFYPSFPSWKPETWSAGGYLKTGAGHLAAVMAPVSGAIDAFVEQPVTQVTGNPEAGSRAGFLAGFGLPVPKGGAALAAGAKSALPAGRATSALVDAIGPENVPAAIARLRENPRLSLMDVSDPVRTMAQGLIDPAQPRAQQLLTDFAKRRAGSAPAEANEAFTAAMGPAPDVMKAVEALKARAQEVGKNFIQPAIEKAGPVDITPVIADLDKTIGPYALKALKNGEAPKLPMTAEQSKAWEIRQRLRGDLPDREQMFMDPAQAHEIQSRMRYEASQLGSSAQGSERLLSSTVMGARNKLVDALDGASAGYKDSLGKYRDALHVQEAFESGFDTLKNRSGMSGLGDRPEGFRQWINNATPEEIVARRLGTRADIDQKINAVKNPGLAAETITKIPYNQQKLEMLFGPEEAQRLVRRMEDAHDVAITNAKLTAGSKTAETLAGQKATEVRKVGAGNPLQYFGPVAGEALGQMAGLPGLGGSAVLTLGLLHRAGQKVGQISDKARNFEIARMASASGPAREQALSALLSHPQVARQLQKPGNALLAP